MTDVWINGTGIETYGVNVTKPLAGWRDYPEHQFGELKLAGGKGSVLSVLGLVVPPRRGVINVELVPASFSARQAALDALTVALTGTVQIKLADATDRYINAVLVNSIAGTYGGMLWDKRLLMSLEFLCGDPLWYATSNDSVTIPTGSATVTLTPGTAGLTGNIHITGFTTSTTLLLKDSLGNTLNTMTLTGSLGGGYLLVDLQKQQLKKVVGATVTDAFDWKAATDQFPVIGPAAGQTFSLGDSAATGAFTATKTYWR
jgi:hypothetical protein